MNREQYITRLREAVEATEVHSPTAFSWFGRLSPRLRRNVERDLTPRTARSYLTYNLQWRLYYSFYCTGRAIPVARHESGQRMAGVPRFVEQLVDANQGNGCWESGWAASSISDTIVDAEKGGLHLLARPDQCRSSGNSEITPEAKVSLRFAKGNPSLSAGFYMAMGDRELPVDGSERLARLYWNISPAGSLLLMRSATGLLNSAAIPFRLKVVNDPAGFARCDAAVLYIIQSYYPALADIMQQVYAGVRPYLRTGVPALTKTLAMGLGLAEDPGDGDSFGLHRCRMLAEGLAQAYDAGKTGTEARLQRVLDRFSEEGVEMGAPFLAPGSQDSYSFAPPDGKPESTYVGTQVRDTSDGDVSYIETAHAIGQHLMRDAVWDDGLCNWVGAETRVGSARGVYAALGPDVYTGTAGVALYLAELYKATGGAELRATALGAMRQALSQAECIAPGNRVGLYTGWMGIAVAAVRVGLLTRQDDLIESGWRLALGRAEMGPGAQHDLLAGSAGAILGCLLLEEMRGDKALRPFAVRLGDALIKAANRKGDCFSWPLPGAKYHQNLTGLSHGAAGIGLALLELWAATGEDTYCHAAEGAFTYERSWFDASEANWPDFREKPFRSHGRPVKPSFALYWCHGAPGIALSRLRAAELLGDARYTSEAQTALRTTARSLESDLRLEQGNYSLCHGLAGNAHVLMQGARLPADDGDDFARLASMIANQGIARFSSSMTWPCGTGHGQAPGLMLGLAGIGHFYLHLHDPSLPSALLLRPADWRQSASSWR
ncbi:MAG: lanthionine synthetase LanC family protein [Chloroflexota bacterium]